MDSTLFKLLLFIFTFNIMFLLFHFIPPASLLLPTATTGFRNSNELSLLKPWPTLPSYFPWLTISNTANPGSCESFFGNGFTQSVDFLGEGGGDGGGEGWFRCRYNPTLRSSVCEGGRVRMAGERIRMARGGERLEEVMGRREEEELPVFEEGAFEVEGESGFWFPWRKWGNGGRRRLVGVEELERFLPDNDVQRHTMRELIGGIRVVGKDELRCDQVFGLVFWCSIS